MKHIKAFATQAEVATYEQSQQYVEPYIGASYDSVAAHYNHNTPVYKQFYDYDDETHQYNLYEQVEYITNPSTAYINTELIAFNTARIEAVLKANARKAQMQLFGVYGSTMSIELYCNSQSNSATVFAYSAQDISDGGDWISTGVWSTEKLKFVLDVTYTKANGENSRGLTIYNADGSLNKYISPKTLINNPNNRHSDTKPFYICTCDPNSSASGGVGVGRFAPINIYSFKIIDTRTNTVNRDFIPVKRINDNVYGLWDRANSKFYVSPNGTQFTGGAKMIYDANDVQYQQVDYISNPSTAYIDTGIYGTMDLDFYIEFLPTELSTTYKTGAGSIFGSRSAYNSRAYQLTTYNKVSPYSASTRGHFLCANNYGWNDNKAPTANMLLNQKNIIKKENLIFTRADGSTFTLTSQTFTTAATITIFQCAGAGEPAKIKLYKLQFSRGGTVLRDFIPVKRVSDSKYGLFDCVNKQFYTSQTDVDFTGE